MSSNGWIFAYDPFDVGQTRGRALQSFQKLEPHYTGDRQLFSNGMNFARAENRIAFPEKDRLGCFVCEADVKAEQVRKRIVYRCGLDFPTILNLKREGSLILKESQQVFPSHLPGELL